VTNNRAGSEVLLPLFLFVLLFIVRDVKAASRLLIWTVVSHFLIIYLLINLINIAISLQDLHLQRLVLNVVQMLYIYLLGSSKFLFGV
jgi:hypothetical protein